MPLPDVVSGLLLSPRSPVRARAGVPGRQKEPTPFRFRLTAKTALMLAPSSFSESNPLRWASIRVFKVISRRRRRPIDRWCCFSFPNRTHFIGLRFGSYQGAKHRSVSASRRKLHYVGSFFLFRIEPAPLSFDLLFLQQGGQAQFVPARLRIFFRFPIFTF